MLAAAGVGWFVKWGRIFSKSMLDLSRKVEISINSHPCVYFLFLSQVTVVSVGSVRKPFM